MYAYIELSNIAQTDSIIQSLSWMNSRSTSLGKFSNGWLATGNKNHIVSITYTSIKSNENLLIPDRTNFNLRAHRSDVRFVSWNIPYEKLATIDEKGVIFVWIKHDNRWSLELINDRSHSVTDMSWSYDGRMTVICYEDGFILVGSVTGQRYWSTVLNIPQAKVSAVTWMPDISHVILGTTTGQLIVLDDHGNTIEICSLSTKSIRQLIYSCHKFYLEAPANNVTKFVNDDYILACSLENGQVLLMNNYHDQSPIIIDTNLQNIQIDWSYPSEILAIGGYKYLNENIYHNEIIFYTRRGEFLHRIHIPQMTQPLTALCWAHGNEIIFVACSSFVYTIWIIHKPLLSLLTLCQMKIKENLLKNSLENLDQLFLQNHLKTNLLEFYRSTIKGFLPDQKSLHSFVCQPLKHHLRLQCTMKRIDNEKDINSSTIGAIYVLYLEYLGGLIPLLTAKRISKICSDFIIYDPDIKMNHLSLKSSLTKLNSLEKNNFLLSKIPQRNNNRSNLIYVAKTDVNNNPENFLTKKKNSKLNSNCESINDLQEKENTNKLCTIAANIWGTRFKFYGHSKHLSSIIGNVTYKTSFLHLQPRQMTVTVINNSNICKSIQSKYSSISKFKQPLSSKLIRTTSTMLIKDLNHIKNPILGNSFKLKNSNQLKKLSSSEPILNQTRKIHQQYQIVTKSFRTKKYFSIEQIPSDDDDDDDEDEIKKLKQFRKYSSPRHRLMTCTSGMNDSLLELSSNEPSFYVMQNRPPLWNEQSQVYQLDFGGRVTLESAKNFQIEFKNKQVIQFGRIENNCYTLDFEWPFSPVQAFAVALANITQRLK